MSELVVNINTDKLKDGLFEVEAAALRAAEAIRALQQAMAEFVSQADDV